MSSPGEKFHFTPNFCGLKTLQKSSDLASVSKGNYKIFDCHPLGIGYPYFFTKNCDRIFRRLIVHCTKACTPTITSWLRKHRRREILVEPFSPTFSDLWCKLYLRQDPLDLSFWSFLTFLYHGIEEVERHLLWKFYKKIRKKSWSNVPPKLLACMGFLYKVVHKTGHLRKFNRSREIEFNFLTAWTISMKFGTLVQHAPGYKNCLNFLIFG